VSAVPLAGAIRREWVPDATAPPPHPALSPGGGEGSGFEGSALSLSEGEGMDLLGEKKTRSRPVSRESE